MGDWSGVPLLISEVDRISGSEFTSEVIEKIVNGKWAEGKRPARALLDHGGLVSENDMQLLIRKMHAQVNLGDPSELDYDLASLLPTHVCTTHTAIIYGEREGKLLIAAKAATVQNTESVAHILEALPKGKEASIHYGNPRQISACIAAMRSHQQTDFSIDLVEETADDIRAEAENRYSELISGNDEVSSKAGSHLDALLLKAISSGASDIHLSTSYDELGKPIVWARLRRLGDMQDHAEYPWSIGKSIINRFRMTGGMKIDETEDNDARYDIEVPGTGRFDLRLCYIPKPAGRTLTIRLLSQERSGIQTIYEIFPTQFTEAAEQIDRVLVSRPHSIFMVVGPTGEGKSTTSAAILDQLNTPDVKCMSIENPIEYRIPGVEQIQVTNNMGFAKAVRAFMRSDPNNILIGEVRDDETAASAISAAQTGHRVLTTLHSLSAGLAPRRLIELGRGRFTAIDLAEVLAGVVSQKLVKLLCTTCMSIDENNEPQLGEGCDDCEKSGWESRTAVAEVLVVNDEVYQGIIDGKSSRYLLEQSASQTFDDHARRLLEAKRTTRSELLRVFGALPCLGGESAPASLLRGVG